MEDFPHCSFSIVFQQCYSWISLASSLQKYKSYTQLKQCQTTKRRNGDPPFWRFRPIRSRAKLSKHGLKKTSTLDQARILCNILCHTEYSAILNTLPYSGILNTLPYCHTAILPYCHTAILNTLPYWILCHIILWKSIMHVQKGKNWRWHQRDGKGSAVEYEKTCKE